VVVLLGKFLGLGGHKTGVAVVRESSAKARGSDCSARRQWWFG
jgi:hypothetical protein